MQSALTSGDPGSHLTPSGQGPAQRPDDVPRGRELVFAALLAASVSLIYVAVAWAHGAIGVARADDWAHYRVAYGFAESGRFEPNGWPQMMLVGQVLLAWPFIKAFGPQIPPLQLLVAGMGAVGLWAAYVLCRSFVPRTWALVAVSCLAVGPLFGSLGVSFMTDVPSFTLQVLTLVAGLHALRTERPSIVWFALSLALCVVAFSVREFGAAAGLVVCLLVLERVWVVERRRLGVYLAATVVWGLLLCALFLWRRTLPHSNNPVGALSMTRVNLSVGVFWRAGMTLALFIAPVLAAVSPVKLFSAAWSRARAWSIAVTGVSVLLALKLGPEFVGNYFRVDGSYAGGVSGPAPRIFPVAVWLGLRMVGFLGLLVLALLPGVRWTPARRRLTVRPRLRTGAAVGRRLTALFLLSTLVLTSVTFVVLGTPFFDRYLLVFVPLTAALVIEAGRAEGVVAGRPRARVAGGLVGLCCVGLVLVDAAATFDGARWKLASVVAGQGYDPAAIDGGFEWFSFHQEGFCTYSPVLEGRFWVRLFPKRPICATSVLLGPGAQASDERSIADLTARTLLGVEYRLRAERGPDQCPAVGRGR